MEGVYLLSATDQPYLLLGEQLTCAPPSPSRPSFAGLLLVPGNTHPTLAAPAGRNPPWWLMLAGTSTAAQAMWVWLSGRHRRTQPP